MIHQTLPAQIAEQVKKLILSEKYLIGTMLPSIKRLQVELGCSKNTAISAVHALAREGIVVRAGSTRQGFIIARQPEEILDSGKGIPKTTVKLILTFNYWNYVGNRLLESLEETFSNHGVSILFSNHKNSPALEEKILLRVSGQKPDRLGAIIIMPSASYETSNLKLLKTIGKTVPLIFLDRFIDGFTSHYIGVNNRLIGSSSVHFLADRGHRAIAFFCGFSRISTAKERLEGYMEGLIERKLRPSPNLVAEFDSLYETLSSLDEKVLQSLDQFLAADTRPTAIICDSDKSARVFVNQLQKRGIQVPNEIAIIGCDDDKYISNPSELQLTTFRYPYKAIAEQAINLFKTVVADPIAARRKIEFEATMIPGQTT